MSRVFKGCCKGEQSLVREEGVRPSLMGGFASSEPGPLVLLAQDGSQPPPNETIKVAELEWCGVLEIAEPSPQRRIEIRDDPREAVTSAAYSLGPHLVLERSQALLSHEPATRLEPVAEEIESLSRLSAVDDPRLVRMQRQAVGRRPRLDFTQRSYRRGFRLAEDHEVVGVTHHPAPVLLHQQVERVQVDVGQQRREDCPLGRSPRRQPARHVRHDLLPEKALDQRQDAPVADRLAHPCHQLVVRDRIEVTLQVGIHYMSEALLQQPIDLPQRIFAASSRPEAVTSRPELDFKDWLNGHLQSRLHDAVLDGRYPERTGLPAAFGNIDPFDRARPVAAVLTPNVRSLRLLRLAFPTFRPHPRWLSHGRFVRRLSAEGLFQASPRTSRLATALRRIRFVILRTASSPPDALHPASRRRSLLRLRSCDQLRNGLTPFCQSVLTDALVPAKAGTPSVSATALIAAPQPRVLARWPTAFAHNTRRWLWVPAFAGTTPEDSIFKQRAIAIS